MVARQINNAQKHKRKQMPHLSQSKSPDKTPKHAMPTPHAKSPYTSLLYAFIALFVFIALVRLASLALYPLMDPTEARYAEMARKILELNDWVVLHFTYDAPFWGKPPLSFWGSAVGMSIFGVNEFGARIAPFVAGLCVCALFFAWDYDKPQRPINAHNLGQNPLQAGQNGGGQSLQNPQKNLAQKARNLMLPLASAIILLSSALGLVACGAVMTDEFLLLCVGLCMVGFWRCVASENLSLAKNHINPTISGQNPQTSPLDSEFKANSVILDKNSHDNASQKSRNKATLWGYMFFVGLGLGLLAKGPLILVLAGTPIIGFIVLAWLFNRIYQSRQNPQNHAQTTAQNPKIALHYQNLPIFSGSILALLIALPWYILCEMRSEGFLEYFIVGEHFKRFLVSGWEGDLYGSAHSRRLGSIWIFFLVAFLPWSIIFVGFTCVKIAKIAKVAKIFRTSTQDCNNAFSRFCNPLLANLFTHNGKTLYLTLWLLTPLAFFTLSRNVLWTYVLPCAIPFSILLAEWILLPAKNAHNAQHAQNPSSTMPLSAFAKYIWILPFVLVGFFGAFIPTQNAQELLSPYHHKDIFTRFSGDSRLIYIGFSPSYSAEFYTHAKNDTLRAQNPAITPLREEIYAIKDLQECASNNHADLNSCTLAEVLNSKERVSIAIKSSDFATYSEFFTRLTRSHFTPITESKGITLLQNF